MAALCPFTQKACPEHNKEGGCQFWQSSTVESAKSSAVLNGCTFVLGTMLQMHSVNNMSAVVEAVERVESEISASRVETLQAGAKALLAAQLQQGSPQLTVNTVASDASDVEESEEADHA